MFLEETSSKKNFKRRMKTVTLLMCVAVIALNVKLLMGFPSRNLFEENINYNNLQNEVNELNSASKTETYRKEVILALTNLIGKVFEFVSVKEVEDSSVGPFLFRGVKVGDSPKMN